MKDLPTRYWLEDYAINIDLESELKAKMLKHKKKFAIITVHDVCPEFRSKITVILNELDKLEIPYSVAVIPLYNGRKKNDIRKNKSLINFLLHREQEIALHGFYHERMGNIEEFRDLTKKQAKRNLINGLKFFRQAGIGKTNTFIPPTWAVNKQSIEALENFKFKVIETEEEIILLDKHKRLLSTVLNWDLGSVKIDMKYHGLIKRLFRKQVLRGCSLIRLAIHPKDPSPVLAEQCRMIKELHKKGYKFIRYSDIYELF